jgi:hypothetical protein
MTRNWFSTVRGAFSGNFEFALQKSNALEFSEMTARSPPWVKMPARSVGNFHRIGARSIFRRLRQETVNAPDASPRQAASSAIEVTIS